MFLTARVGIGKGGGLSYPPTGGSPGYDPCQTNQDFNAYLGFFAEAGKGIRGQARMALV